MLLVFIVFNKSTYIYISFKNVLKKKSCNKKTQKPLN